MALAKSEVQVAITSKLGSGFATSFQTAGRSVASLTKATSEAGRALAGIDAYRKQQGALNDTKQAWQAAKQKANEFKAAITAQGAPTRNQIKELASLEKASNRAGESLGMQQKKLAAMAGELQRAGVNTKNLSSEYSRLKASIENANNLQRRAELDSIDRQRRLEAVLQRRAQLEKQNAEAMARYQARLDMAKSAWQGIAQTAAGVTAAGMVLANPTRKAMSYDEQLTYMADTATGGEGPEAYKRNKDMIATAVNDALAYGGGKREDAATALNSLVASGQFSIEEALVQLKEVVKTATASGASSEDIAQAAIAMKSAGISDPGSQFDKLLRAGQLGSFELRDMAKWLPRQLAAANNAGINGTQGLTDILAFNQVSRRTAGTADEAGNNVQNLLLKFSSAEFSRAVAGNVKVQKDDPFTKDKKGKKEFDWSSYAMREREQGVSQIDAFAKLVERQLAGNKDYVKLQDRLAKAGTDSEKKETLSAMSGIAMGSEMGKFIGDQQAMMAALASLYFKDDMKNLRTEINNSEGAVDRSSQNVRGETWSKAQDVSNAAAEANRQAYDKASGPLGSVMETATNLAREFPTLTTAAYSASVAIGALAAAAGAGGLAGILMGKGGAKAAGTVAAGAGAKAAGAVGAAGAAAKAGGLARGAAAGAAIVGAGGFAVDWAAGKLGAGQTQQDEAALDAQDSANWSRASTGEKMQSGAARAIEGIGSLFFLDNIVKEARAARVASETKYLDAKGGGAAATAAQGSPLADKVIESSTAAADAAKAASEAATVSQNKPNLITQNNSYTVTVTAGPDANGIAAQVSQALRMQEQGKAAELRSSFMGQPNF